MPPIGLFEKPGQSDGGDPGARFELLRCSSGQSGTGDPIPGLLECFPGQKKGGGFAGTGLPDDHLDARSRCGQGTDHGQLLG